MSNVTIRPAVPKDHDAIATIWQDSWRSVRLTHLIDPPLTFYRERIPREIENGWSLHVAEIGDKAVAMLAFRTLDAHLDQLFVAPDHQGNGIGHKLLEFARQQLPAGMWLRTASDNRRACQWYEREGFILEKEVPHPASGLPMRYYRWRPD